MPATRPYFVTYNDIRHLVEASDPAKAIQHVVGAVITEIRPARGAEVTAWIRGNGALEIAGEKVAAGTAFEATIVSEAAFEVQDARAWIVDQLGITPGDAVSDEIAATIGAFDRVVEAGVMGEDEFNVLASGVPNFLDAIISGIDMVTDSTAASVVALGQIPMKMDALVDYIAARKKYELWALDQPGGVTLPGEKSDRDEQIAE